MGSIIKISNLSEVKPFKTSWIVEVKVLHKWISFSHQCGASIELVLADKNGVKIHASCKQSLVPTLESHFTVGDWKVITNFQLRSASGFYRTTKNVYKMEFLTETNIAESNIQCQNMFLNLHDFDSVSKIGLHDQCYLIDVVGEVLNLGALDLVQCSRKEVTKVEFLLRDKNDHHLHCCITGLLAHKLTQEQGKLNNRDICLIRFAKVSSYKGELLISNAFDVSSVLINPDIPEAEALKAMLHDDNNRLPIYQAKNVEEKLQNKRLRWSEYPFRSIQEMKRADQDGNFRVICTVYAIETMMSWYYLACVVCNKQVCKPPVVFQELDANNWWCQFCHSRVKNVTPRFMLTLLVQDQTGESIFNLSDAASTFIVKCSAAKVLKTLPNEIDNQDNLPPQLVDIVGKTYGFGISVDGNKGSSVRQFNAIRVWNLNDIIWKRIKSLHQLSTGARKKQCISGGDLPDRDHSEAKEN